MSEEIKNTVNRTEKSANAAKIIIAVALALLIAAAAFTAGFFTGNCAVSDDARSLDWLLKTIEENYYFYDDFDADGAGEDSLKSIADKLDIYSEYYTAEGIPYCFFQLFILYKTDSIRISTLITSFMRPVFTASSASTHFSTAARRVLVLNLAACPRHLLTMKGAVPILEAMVRLS